MTKLKPQKEKKSKIVETPKLDTTTAAEVRQNVQDTFDITGGDVDERKEWSTIETQKIILREALNPLNLLSMTGLTADEIEDIENARMLNIIANNPLIEQVCNDHMLLNRSFTDEPKSMLHHVFGWSMRGLGLSDGSSAISRVLGKKGSN